MQNISVRSATGSNLTPIGLVNCSFELGRIKFNGDFIVCKNLTRPLILGRDFLIWNHVSVRYAENGKCILDYQQQELIASMNIENKPQLNLAYSMTLPGRSLAVVCVCNNLEPDQSGQIYEVQPSQILNDKYPNLCIIPMMHNVDIHKTENIPLVVINLSMDDVYLSKGEIMGFNAKSIFITETQQNAFKDLCTEFKDIFSTDSSDIRKTQVIVYQLLKNPILFL